MLSVECEMSHELTGPVIRGLKCKSRMKDLILNASFTFLPDANYFVGHINEWLLFRCARCHVSC